jgi:hypothetical protein
VFANQQLNSLVRLDRRSCLMMMAGMAAGLKAAPLWAEGEWESNAESRATLARGLEWLRQNQGDAGNWESNDLGLVGMGALAFLAAGYMPGRGRYGETVARALNYIINNAKTSGLLNESHSQRDMYNHGLATFVLGQAHGMTTNRDKRLSQTLERALDLIAATQCEDGGWDYRAQRQKNGHDLSLAVMQAKALRSAMDSGLEVSPEVIELAIQSVREHYSAQGRRGNVPESQLRQLPGQFTYSRGGGGASVAMAAAGVVCLQEFGQYDDWRIGKSMQVILDAVQGVARMQQGGRGGKEGTLPFDAYTLYYVGQALYQVGGRSWEASYPVLRDYLVEWQRREGGVSWWMDRGGDGGGRVGGKPGELYGTSVACFILAIPNRFLPILQEGKIESLRQQFAS